MGLAARGGDLGGFGGFGGFGAGLGRGDERGDDEIARYNIT